ncbi:MAG: MBL fold metallo-hydrolase [bacterium]|nr:MBL fold metallo-hydrolase [bacterium]
MWGMKLTCYGGVEEVTGANYILEHEGTTLMIDCGLQQRGHYSEKNNWGPFSYDVTKINAVLITHAHIDHVGRLPKLMKEGFHGRVYSTFPTKDFASILLADSEHILLKEAEREKKEPLYTLADIEKIVDRWEGVAYHQEVKIGPFVVTFYNAAHILGSSIIVIEADGTRIAFSGDLGNSPAPIIGKSEIPDDIDYCVIEATYGDRLHPKENTTGIIENIIEETAKAGGTLMIPAFAMERTQKLLFEIDELMRNGRVPMIPVFLDSKLAIKITETYKKYRGYFDRETLNILKQDLTLFDFPTLKKTISKEESRAINDVPAPKIIIAGSGMSHGGRILHHEKRYLPDPKSTIILVGYQGENSLGRQILNREPTVRIHGEEVAVRCRVVNVPGYSAHADQEQLLAWLHPLRLQLKKVFVVQGEKNPSAILAQKIINDLAVKAEVPELGKAYEII